MKKLLVPIAFATVMTLSAFTAVNSMDWKIAEGYNIAFTSKDPSGVFKTMHGDISFDPNNLDASKFNVSVDVNSINTGNGMRNNKAKGEKFFDADKYPTITFVSTKMTKTPAGFETKGTLTMHGVQKEITIPFTFVNNTFAGSFSVNRLEYGVGDDKGMSAHVSTDLHIDVSVPVAKK